MDPSKLRINITQNEYKPEEEQQNHMADFAIAEQLANSPQGSPRGEGLLGAPKPSFGPPRMRRSKSADFLQVNTQSLRIHSAPNSAHSSADYENSSESEAGFALRRSRSQPTTPCSPRSPARHVRQGSQSNLNLAYDGDRKFKQHLRSLQLLANTHKKDKCMILQASVNQMQNDKKLISDLRARIQTLEAQVQAQSVRDPLGSVVSSMTDNALPLLPNSDIIYHLPMAITTTQGVFVSANEMFCRLTGYTEADLLQRTIFSLSHRESLGLTCGFISTLLSNSQMPEHDHKSYNCKLMWLMANNTLQNVHVTGSTITKRQGMSDHVITHFVFIASKHGLQLPENYQIPDNFAFPQLRNSPSPQPHSPQPQQFPQHTPNHTPQHSPRPLYTANHTHTPQHSPRRHFESQNPYDLPQRSPRFPQHTPGHTPQQSPRPQYEQQRQQPSPRPQHFHFNPQQSPQNQQHNPRIQLNQLPNQFEQQSQFEQQNFEDVYGLPLSPHNSVLSPSDASVVDMNIYQSP